MVDGTSNFSWFMLCAFRVAMASRFVLGGRATIHWFHLSRKFQVSETLKCEFTGMIDYLTAVEDDGLFFSRRQRYEWLGRSDAESWQKRGSVGKTLPALIKSRRKQGLHSKSSDSDSTMIACIVFDIIDFSKSSIPNDLEQYGRQFFRCSDLTPSNCASNRDNGIKFQLRIFGEGSYA